MKAKNIPSLSNNYSEVQSTIDNSQTSMVTHKKRLLKRNRAKGIENDKQNNKNVGKILEGLYELSGNCAEIPGILSGPLRHLKVEPHYREPLPALYGQPKPYRLTSKIRLTGNWIEKAGFETHERIRVIPMHRMLIIVPELQTDIK